MPRDKQRSLTLLEIYGTEITIERAAKIAGCQVMTIHNRLVAGWEDRAAIFTSLTKAERDDEADSDRELNLSSGGSGFGRSGYGGNRHPAEAQEIQYHGGRFNKGEW